MGETAIARGLGKTHHGRAPRHVIVERRRRHRASSPRCFRAVPSLKKDCTVGLSYLEVYNEAVYDLLALDEEPLTVREDAAGSVVVPGLTEMTC